MKWVRLQPLIRDVTIHIPNEGKRDVYYANKLKRMGMRKGVSDVFIARPTKTKHGLWMDLKRTKYSKVSPEQLEWLNLMRELDFGAYLAYGCHHAIDITKTHYAEDGIILI